MQVCFRISKVSRVAALDFLFPKSRILREILNTNRVIGRLLIPETLSFTQNGANIKLKCLEQILRLKSWFCVP